MGPELAPAEAGGDWAVPTRGTNTEKKTTNAMMDKLFFLAIDYLLLN
jgi:hypothetical protein